MDMPETSSPVALITGGSRGLGLALGRELAGRGWTLVIDARGEEPLRRAGEELGPRAIPLAGDVTHDEHRRALADAVGRVGRLDLLVNNASVLGPSPRPTLDRYPTEELERVLQVNTIAPVALIQLVLPVLMASSGVVIDITSDAAVEAYPGWGGYGASKAALDQLSAVLAAEQPALRVYAFDPGDMRTQMQQEAFPEEDISDRPEPGSVVPALLRLIDERPPSGRYRVSDLLAATGGIA